MVIQGNFYKIIWKSANQFGRRRRILKFVSFCCHGNKNSAWIPTIWRKSGEVIERMLSVKFHPNWPTGYWGEEVDARQTKGDHNNSPWAKLRWPKNKRTMMVLYGSPDLIKLKKFSLFFVYTYIQKSSKTPWWPCLSSYQNNLKS